MFKKFFFFVLFLFVMLIFIAPIIYGGILIYNSFPENEPVLIKLAKIGFYAFFVILAGICGVCSARKNDNDSYKNRYYGIIGGSCDDGECPDCHDRGGGYLGGFDETKCPTCGKWG